MSKTIDESLYEVLNADPALAALIGTGTAMRLYPVEAPPGAVLPLLIYQVISTDPQTTHAQGTGDDARLDQHRVELMAQADTQLACAQILKAGTDALEASTTLKGIHIDERALPRAEEAKSHGRSADYLCWNNPDAAAA